MTSLDKSGPNTRANVARRFLDCLAIQDFEKLATTLSDDVRLRALLPGDTQELHGPEPVKAALVDWFGDTQEFELIDTAVDDLRPRVHIWWQVRVRAERLGDGSFKVEQHAYAEIDEHNRIRHLWLICSGHSAEKRSQ